MPTWMRITAPLIGVLIIVASWHSRGVPIGIAALVSTAPMTVSTVTRLPSMRSTRRHRVLGLMLGAAWVCLSEFVFAAMVAHLTDAECALFWCRRTSVDVYRRRLTLGTPAWACGSILRPRSGGDGSAGPACR